MSRSEIMGTFARVVVVDMERMDECRRMERLDGGWDGDLEVRER